MGSDESHFNVSLIVGDKVTRQCPQTTIIEEKGEPKRIRTEVPPLTSLTPYRQAKPAHAAVLNRLTSFKVSKSGLKFKGGVVTREWVRGVGVFSCKREGVGQFWMLWSREPHRVTRGRQV